MARAEGDGMAREFGQAEPDAVCPVPLERLGQLYRSDPTELMEQIGDMEEGKRVQLAVYCYGRAHLREVGLSIAATCSEGKLVEVAGMIGQALSIQCRGVRRSFGLDAPRPTEKVVKVSLAGRAR